MPKFGFYQTEHKNNNFFAFLQKQVWENPEKTLLKWVSPETLIQYTENSEALKSEAITIKTFSRMANKLAQQFLAAGIRENDPVVLGLPLSLQYYLSFFSLSKIGALTVLFDNWKDVEKITTLCQKTVKPRALLTYPPLMNHLLQSEYFKKTIQLRILAGELPKDSEINESINHHFKDLLNSKLEAETVPVEQDHSCLITYSNLCLNNSGELIGPDRTHRFLAAQYYAFRRTIPHREDDRELSSFPLFILNNIAAGVQTTIPAIDPYTFSADDGDKLFAQIESDQINRLSLWPHYLLSLIQSLKKKNKVLPEMRNIITGGGVLGPEHLKELKTFFPKAKIQILYGNFEAEPLAAIDDKEFLTSQSEDSPHGVCLGQFDSGVSYKILKRSSEKIEIEDFMDWQNYEVQSGQSGELIIAGEHVCRQYFQNEKAFEEKKILDDFGIVWHKTGDLVTVDKEKKLWLQGRIHNCIEIDGHYYAPEPIEAQLSSLPEIESAAYFSNGQKIFCVVVPTKENLNKDDEIGKLIKSQLEKDELPFDEVKVKSSIPHDPTYKHKVNYDQLKMELNLT